MTRVAEKFLAENQVQETPSGSVNGSNTSFSLSQKPENNAALSLYLDGLILDQGVDYTISSLTITMTTAPALAQKLKAVYLTK